MKNKDQLLLEQAYSNVNSRTSVNAYYKNNIKHVKELFKFDDQYFLGEFMTDSTSTRLSPDGWIKLYRVLEGPYTEQELKDREQLSDSEDLTDLEYVGSLVKLYLERKEMYKNV